MDAFREKPLLLMKRITPILFGLAVASYHFIFEVLPEQFAVPVTLWKDILGMELWYLCDEVTGGWRKLHNEELNVLYSSPNIVRVIKSRRMRWSGRVVHMGEERGVYRVLVGKPGGKRSLGRPRRRWEDNIMMDLQEVGCGSMDWIELAQDRDRWRVL